MNRPQAINAHVKKRVPHMRGDEPTGRMTIDEVPTVFPTCVGMNRMRLVQAAAKRRVPHMRGDEPGAWMSFLKFVNSDSHFHEHLFSNS